MLQEKSYALYNSSIGRHANVTVRRKVGEPCDTLHAHSQKVRLQRNRFSKAAKDYAGLTYHQKRAWRQRIEFI